MDWASPPKAPIVTTAATIVVIDDDLALLNALKFDLELEGFNVMALSSGRQVRAADLPASNGCMVIDYRMPGLDGLELLRRLRKAGNELPAILITSHPGSELTARASALGGRIIEKPLLGDALLAGIRSAIG